MKSTKRTEVSIWLIALIVVFALGYLLGRLLAPKCPACPAPQQVGHNGNGAGGGGGGGGGAGGGGRGTPSKGDGGGSGDGTGRVLGAGGTVDGSGGGGSAGSGAATGDMTGGGGGGASGTTTGQGYDGSAAGAKGSDDGGGGQGGNSKLGDSPNDPYKDSDPKKQTESGVWKLAAGAPLSPNGVDTQQDNGSLGSVKVLSAPDFRYDKTGLPRYPDANMANFSAMSVNAGGAPDRYGSSSGILTTSPFNEVVEWYRKNLPAGWFNSTVGDLNQLGAMAQQLSPDKIMQMLSAPDGSGQGKSLAETPATAVNRQLRLSIFSAPPRTKGDLGVMIVQQGDKPVQIFMKTQVQPQ